MTQVQKLKEHQKIHKRGDPPSMFTDPLDSSSSDDMSFDEEDMYGSDPDVESISLGAGSNDNMQCLDEEVVCVPPAHAIYSTLYIWQDSDSVLGMAGMTLAISKLDILARALCDADEIDIPLLGSNAEEESDSTSLPQNTSDMSMELEEAPEDIEGSV